MRTLYQMNSALLKIALQLNFAWWKVIMLATHTAVCHAVLQLNWRMEMKFGCMQIFPVVQNSMNPRNPQSFQDFWFRPIHDKLQSNYSQSIVKGICVAANRENDTCIRFWKIRQQYHLFRCMTAMLYALIQQSKIDSVSRNFLPAIWVFFEKYV